MFRPSSSVSEPCTCTSGEKGVRVAPRRTNRVRRINRRLPFEQFVEALETDGCVIVEDFVNPQISQRVTDAEHTQLDSTPDAREGRSLVVDVNALIRESLISDSLFQTLSAHFLTLETLGWHNQHIEMNVSKPRVSESSTFDLNHQYLSTTHVPADFHRADGIYHVRHAADSKYDYLSRRDVALGLFVPELDSLSASVPVHMVPGSHLWDDSKPDFSEGIKNIQLRGGEAIILLGSLYHQVGAPAAERSVVARTDSGLPKEKLMHSVWMCSGIYRAAHELENDDET